MRRARSSDDGRLNQIGQRFWRDVLQLVKAIEPAECFGPNALLDGVTSSNW